MKLSKETRKLLAERIISLRKEKGISSENLAYSCGIGKATLNFIEREKSDPRLSTLETLAEGLDITLQELLDF